MMFAKMTGCVETWQSSFLIRARQWSQCLVTCWSKGSSQCFCMLMLFEKFLEAFETHLGINGGYFPILEETDPWSALQSASCSPGTGCSHPSNHRHFFNSGLVAGARGWMMGVIWVSFWNVYVYLYIYMYIIYKYICIYIYICFSHWYIFFYIHAYYIRRERGRWNIETNSWCVVCRSKIRSPSKDCLKLVTDPVRNDNAFPQVPWKIYDWFSPKLHASAYLQVNLNKW